MLFDTIFKQLKLDRYKTIVPVLFITATCTRKIYSQLQTLIGLSCYDDKQIVLSNLFHMINSSIFTRLVYTTCSLQSFTAIDDPVLKTGCTQPFIFYTNSRLLVGKCVEWYGEWLDKSSIRSDYLKITGPMKREVTFHVTQIFCKVKIDSDVDSDNVFNPQVLFSTSGASNTGIDNTQIYGVFRAEMPPAVEDFV